MIGLALGLAAQLLENLPALRPCVIADFRRFRAGLVEGRLIAVLGLGEYLGRRLTDLRRLLDPRLPFRQHLSDRRNNENPDDSEHDQEDRELNEEGAIGDQEVPRGLHICSRRHDFVYLPGVAKTKSAMNARLMK